MLRTSVRRALVAVVSTTIATVATLGVYVPPAHAAASGKLLTKATGSLYTEANTIDLGILPGTGPKTFFYKTVNTGTAAQQFKVQLLSAPGSTISSSLFVGSTAQPNPYYTPAIPRGGSFAFTVRLTVPAGTPQGTYETSVVLSDPESGTIVDGALARANVTKQMGTGRNDLFIKTGSQPYVGGSLHQFETASALTWGTTATFTLRLKNNGVTPAAIGLYGPWPSDPTSCGSAFRVTVKKGTQNITASVLAGTHSSGTLAPGAIQELKVMIKLVSVSSACFSNYFAYFTASGLDAPVIQSAHVVVAG